MNELKAKLWYFRTELSVIKCPYNKKATRYNRVALIKQMFNL